MIQNHRMAIALCLFAGITISTLILIMKMNERIKTMSIQKKSPWLAEINETIPTSGYFTAKDKQSKSILLEWIRTDMLSEKYASAMKSVSTMACQAYTTVEMQFLKAHPEVVGTDGFFKPFEPFFKDGLNHVNWALVEEKMQEILMSFFVMDPSVFSEEMKTLFTQVSQIFVIAKDQETKKPLGLITFLVTPETTTGEMKCTTFAIKPEAQNQGLGKLLMSSGLRIIPSVKRIFLCTRITNENAQRAYRNWGFVDEINPIIEEHQYTFNKAHWMFLEYKTATTKLLQQTAATLAMVK